MNKRDMEPIADIQSSDNELSIVFNQIGRQTFLKLKTLLQQNHEVNTVMAGNNPSHLDIQNPNTTEIMNKIGELNLYIDPEKNTIYQPIHNFIEDIHEA